MVQKVCLTEYVVHVLVLLKVGLACVHVHLGFWQALMPKLSLWRVASFPGVLC